MKKRFGALLVGVAGGAAALMLSVSAIAPGSASTGAAYAAMGSTLGSGPITCTLPGDTSTAAGFTAEQSQNAATIISVGATVSAAASLDAETTRRAQVIALMTAMQESRMRNLNYGDRDSLGLFQQRAPWGSAADRTTPAVSAEMFYTGGQGGQRGLFDIPSWQTMALGAAAQAVQVSAFPEAYDQWETLAVSLVGGGPVCDEDDPEIPVGSGVGGRVIAAALSQLGKPYVWGGGTYTGPSGIGRDGRGPGFDCSGLTLYAWYQATGGKVMLPHFTDSQAAMTTPVPITEAQAGDLIFFQYPGIGKYPHVGLYDGQGGMIEAPRTGKDVQRTPNIFSDPYWGPKVAFVGRVNAQVTA